MPQQQQQCGRTLAAKKNKGDEEKKGKENGDQMGGMTDGIGLIRNVESGTPRSWSGAVIGHVNPAVMMMPASSRSRPALVVRHTKWDEGAFVLWRKQGLPSAKWGVGVSGPTSAEE